MLVHFVMQFDNEAIHCVTPITYESETGGATLGLVLCLQMATAVTTWEHVREAFEEFDAAFLVVLIRLQRVIHGHNMQRVPKRWSPDDWLVGCFHLARGDAWTDLLWADRV